MAGEKRPVGVRLAAATPLAPPAPASALEAAVRAAGWLADLLLEREAALIRSGASPVPHDFAGLVISDEEIDALLAGEGDGAPTPPPAPWDEGIAVAREHLVGALAGTPLGVAAEATGLDAAATELLAAAVAVEMDPRRQRLAAFVQNDVNRPRLTLAVVLRLFGWAGLRAVGPDGPLARAALMRVVGDTPWSASQVVPAAALCWAVAGLPGIGADTLRLVDLDLDGERATIARAGDADGAPSLLVVTGADRAARLQWAARAGRGRMAVAAKPETTEEWEALICHATVTGRAPVLETDALVSSDRRWLERAGHLPWVVSAPRELALDALPCLPWQELSAGPSVPASDDEWQAVAGRRRPPGARLNRTQLELVAPLLGDPEARTASALRRLAQGHLDTLTRRTPPRRTWSDLVVGDEQADGLHLICARWRQREVVYDGWRFSPLPSLGVVALFSGPSGTGKTLAAEVVAAELGLDLYRLDISTVVSKYIGETEKNLEQVFTAASAGEVVLFFDEADALFGKRSEVSDAHDRYANIEVAYLLQRLEAHDGLVVLATNLQQNIDPAFLRRIDVLVAFPEPDERQRRAIWERSFGDHAPLGDLDLEWVARRFELTGGEIRNVALEAAFRAASLATPITMSHLMAALRRELRKGGRLCNREDFARWPLSALEATGAPAPR